MLTDRSPFRVHEVELIEIGQDMGWASNMKFCLDRLDSPYLIYLQEDYFLTRVVNSTRVLSLVQIAMKAKAACLRLYPSPAPDRTYDGEATIGAISRQAPYRVSLQAAIWNRETLLSLLVDGETGWDMEMAGTERSRDIDLPFLSVLDVQDPAITYLHRTAIVKGSWTEEAVEYCRTEGIALDTSKRRVGIASQMLPKAQPPSFRTDLSRRIRYFARKLRHIR